MSDSATPSVSVPASAPTSEATPQAAQSEEIVETGEDLGEITPEVIAKSPEAVKALKELFKLKVDGEEFEEEIDWNDKERIKKALQMEKVANKRMNEKASIEKDMKELVKLLQTTPDAVLQELGINVEEFATGVLNKKLDDMKKSPEQKELEKLRAEAQKEREEKETLKREKEQGEMLRLQEKAKTDFNNELKTALDKEPDLPDSPYVRKRVADLMIYALDNNIKASVKDVLPMVKKEIHNEWFEMFSKMPEDILQKVVGPDNIKRVRKSILQKQKESAQTAQAIVPTGNSELKNTEKKTERIKTSDFFKTIGRR